MTPARLWLRLFLAGFAVVVALLLFTLFTTVPYGDLSRIGRVSDHQFGWRAPAAQVDAKYLHDSPIPEADILVLGDSFSMTGRWQSVLTKEGYRVATIFWAHYGETACEDFESWIGDAGFRGKLVIVESVERLLADRLRRSKGCKTAQRPVQPSGAFLLPPTPPALYDLYWSAPLTTGWVTYFNTRRALETSADVWADGNALVRSVPDGCAYFSHRACERALFFGEDVDNGNLNEKNVASMQAFTQAHSRVPMIWMVIPNKTTVYLDPGHSKGFEAAFRASGLGPDLFSFAMNQKARIRDFYFPNDTHMSMHGQLAMGAVMLDAVRQVLPAPSAKAP